jgi:hypothetical protein
MCRCFLPPSSKSELCLNLIAGVLGGKPSSECEGHLKRPPPARASSSRCFCVREIVFADGRML